MKANLVGILLGHQNPIFTLESSYDPRYLFTGGNDKGVVEWDLETLTFKRILCAVPASIYDLHLIPDTHLLAVALRSGEIYIVDIDKQELVQSLQVDTGAVFAIKTLPGKRELIATGEDGYAYIWSLDSYELLYKFKISDTTVRVIAVDSHLPYICFGDKKGVIYVYSLEDFDCLMAKPVHTMPVTTLLTVNGLLYSGGRDAKLHVLRLPGLDSYQSIVPHMFTVYDIAKHPTEDLLATVSRDKTTKLWDRYSLRLLRNISRDRKFDAHHLSINACIWSPYKNLLISVSDDKSVRLWSFDKE